MEILNKFNLAPPPSSPSKGGINKVFPPLGGGRRGRKVLFGASDAFPALEWLELSRPPSGGGLRGRKYCIKRKNRDYPQTTKLKTPLLSPPIVPLEFYAKIVQYHVNHKRFDRWLEIPHINRAGLASNPVSLSQ